MLTKDTWYEVLQEIRKFAQTDKELTHINLEIKIRTNTSGDKKVGIAKVNLTKD